MENIWQNKDLANVLKKGGIAVMPTDTIYGIVGRAENPETVERIYKTRKRNPERPCIILIGDEEELGKFSIKLSKAQKEEIKKYWSLNFTEDKPRAVSIIFACPLEKFAYLHRGTKTLAFRLPASHLLRNLLRNTGPLIAPSANPEGLPTAKNIREAKGYFREAVDAYQDGGELSGQASKVIRMMEDGAVTVLRE